MAKRLTEEERHFRCGFGLALAEVQRMHDNPVAVRDAMEGAGFTVSMMKTAGLDEYDLKELRKAFR